MFKKIVTAVLCLFILAAGPVVFSVVSYADGKNMPSENTDMVLDGLMYEDGHYHYYENEERVTNRWVILDGNTYYFKKNGNAAVSKYKMEGKYYIFNNKGQLIQPASKKVTSVKTANGFKKYYVMPDGTAINGWTKDHKYYFYENMEMAKGIIVIKKKFYCFNADGKYNIKKTSKIRKAAKYEKPFAGLKKIIGNPDKSRYCASCYGNGKDGVLSYDGFTVYTFKPDKGKEIFMDVE
ncbi:MAG: hypothetical protein HFH68_00515 [Lachnospiraceae bacterium]|nr:hypothetical protein [Lachnospiraceae bacterium]